MARETPRPPQRGRGGILLTSGAVRVRGAPRSRAAAKARGPRPRARPRPKGATTKCGCFFSLLVWPTWRPRHPPHPSKVWVRGQCTGVKAFATAICSPEPCQENTAAYGRTAAPRRAGGAVLLTSAGVAARELPRPPRRGRGGGGQFVTLWYHEPKGVCYKAAFFGLVPEGRWE